MKLFLLQPDGWELSGGAMSSLVSDLGQPGANVGVRSGYPLIRTFLK